MTDAGRIRSTVRAALVDRSGTRSAPERLCVGAVSALPVDGATLSVMTEAGSLTAVGASDPVTGRLADLQFTLGEGPCRDAARDGRPVLVGDLTGTAGDRWPMFTPAILRAGFRGLFAFPLQIGAIRLGALGLFRGRPGALAQDTLADALLVADIVALTLVDLPTADRPTSDLPITDLPTGDLPTGESGPSGPPAGLPRMYRVEVHQATGMVMTQLGVGAQEALVRLRAFAYAHGQTADEAAREIVAGRVRLHRDGPR